MLIHFFFGGVHESRLNSVAGTVEPLCAATGSFKAVPAAFSWSGKSSASFAANLPATVRKFSGSLAPQNEALAEIAEREARRIDSLTMVLFGGRRWRKNWGRYGWDGVKLMVSTDYIYFSDLNCLGDIVHVACRQWKAVHNHNASCTFQPEQWINKSHSTPSGLSCFDIVHMSQWVDGQRGKCTCTSEKSHLTFLGCLAH